MRCNIARSIAGGGGSVVVGSYTGNGGTQTVTFESEPAAVIAQSTSLGDAAFVLPQGAQIKQSNTVVAQLSGKVLTMVYSGGDPNINGKVYNYIAFF